MFKILTFLTSLACLAPITKADNYVFFTKDPNSKNLELGLSFGLENQSNRANLSLRLEDSLPAASKVMLGLGAGKETRLSNSPISLGGKLQGYLSFGGEYDTDGDGEIDSHGGMGLMGLAQVYSDMDLPSGWGLRLTGGYKFPGLFFEPDGSEIAEHSPWSYELGFTKSF